MAFTQADIDRLKSAMASGTLKVEVDGKSVTYRSIAEMREVLRMMEGDVKGPSARVSQAAFRRP
ncbi:phage head-tail joining protein [Thalassospira sp.]|uniref:phage head-tail joining protein n=1 Tax=Thalassospira sp. TaxID=1912094 RepID=UPI003AA9692A